MKQKKNEEKTGKNCTRKNYETKTFRLFHLKREINFW